MGNDVINDWLAPIFAAGVTPKSDVDHAVDLAAVDPVRALAIARGIVHPGHRARALAVVARSIEPARADVIAGESLVAAWSQRREFDQANSAIPAITALVERGFSDAARTAMANTRLRAIAATPRSSRATVLSRLLVASLRMDAAVHLQLLDDLVAVQREDDYFRISHALVDALAALPPEDHDLARRIAGCIANPKWRKMALARIPANPAES